MNETYPISQVAMSEKLKTSLRLNKIKTLNQLANFTDEDYTQMKDMGRKCVQEAKELVTLYASLENETDEKGNGF